MKIRIQMIIEEDDGQLTPPTEIFTLERDTLQLETLGLCLEESRQLLFNLQEKLTEQQANVFVAQHQHCPRCQRTYSRKGGHHLRLHTLFGELTLTSPRFYACSCENTKRSSFSPLAQRLQERNTPELLYLQTKWAALMPYDVTSKLLEEILPIEVSPTSLRRHLKKTAERCEQELGDEQLCYIEGSPAEWDELPDTDGPMTVGLDGGYIHLRDEHNRKAGSVEVIVGKSIPCEAQAKCFGFVSGYDEKPRRRIFETLKSQGLQMNQSLLFLSDGGDTVRNLQFYLSPHSEHLLDWFHITMRLTVMQQMVKGLPEKLWENYTRTRLAEQLDQIKWLLWHGNLFRALPTITHLCDILDMLQEECPFPNIPKLLKAVSEFDSYITANRDFIPNYGDRYRYGEIISTAFVESTVNQVISKRFVKKQQMRWTKRGAHLLLQVRVKVLNNEWRTTFTRWYPHMQRSQEPERLALKVA